MQSYQGNPGITNGIPRQEPVPPTSRQDGESKPADTPEAYAFRLNRVVARLKKLRRDNRDLPEMVGVWAEIDKLTR